MQGMLETLGVPYVGSGVAASAVCMDKVLFKDLMAPLGLPQVRYAGIRAERWRAERAGALEQAAALGLPVFVKPAHLGSSVGIVKVTRAGAARATRSKRPSPTTSCVIVEAAAPRHRGRVRACSSGCRGERQPRCSCPSRARSSYESDFYDYEAKYSPGGMELLVPARISHGRAQR